MLIITEASKITKDVYLLEPVWSVYLVVGEELALIEGGISTSAPTVIENIKKFGFSPEDVSLIVIPHDHTDHRSGVGFLLDHMPKAKVVAHSLSVEKLEHPEIPETYKSTHPFAKDWRAKPVEVSRTLKEGDTVGLGGDVELKVLETPGHSKDSICLYDEKRMTLFSSDSVGVFIPWINDVIPNPFYDLRIHLKSLKRLVELPVKTLAFGHCGVATNQDAKTTLQLSLKRTEEWENEILEELRQPESKDHLSNVFLDRFDKGLSSARADPKFQKLIEVYPYRYIIKLAVSRYLEFLIKEKKLKELYVKSNSIQNGTSGSI
jgi:glyoxylase-like metal-dependent hydrolase (beta-lactamase superfamily II)